MPVVPVVLVIFGEQRGLIVVLLAVLLEQYRRLVVGVEGFRASVAVTESVVVLVVVGLRQLPDRAVLVLLRRAIMVVVVVTIMVVAVVVVLGLTDCRLVLILAAWAVRPLYSVFLVLLLRTRVVVVVVETFPLVEVLVVLEVEAIPVLPVAGLVIRAWRILVVVAAARKWAEERETVALVVAAS